MEIRYIIGIDGGGTKTEFVLATSDGRVLYRAVETGCNPNDIGFSSCEALIVSQINKILKEFPSSRITVMPLSGLCCYYAEEGGLLVGFEK